MSHTKTLRRIGILLISCFVGIDTVGITQKTSAIAATEIDLQVGIVQRFGDEPIDEKDEIVSQIDITSTAGDWLTVDWETDRERQQNALSNTSDSEVNQVVKTQKIKLRIKQQTLTEPIVSEKIVLGSHATFETAEADAIAWRNLGIQVEIVQPGRWEVWAKRDVYSTPLVRRWLLDSLKENGYHTPYLSSELLTETPQVVLYIDGKEYADNELEINTSKNLVRVHTVSNKKEATYLYGGSLRLQPNAYGNFSLVNEVPLESYLRGVVPYEIGAGAPANAIAAQTIIARTYALRNLRRFEADDYELCATVHCQVYKGISGATPRTDKAIAQTKGLVLTYNNELTDALYSSTTGGITASFSDVWEGEERPYLRPVIDAPKQLWDISRYPLQNEASLRYFLNKSQGFNETGRKVFRWKRSRSIADLNKDFRRYLKKNYHPLVDFTTITNLEVIKRSASGRILTLLVETDLGIVKLHKNEVRSAFEPPISTLFYLEPFYNSENKLDGYFFIGGGFGHGVGLSQYGSYNLARLGWSPTKILAFYYPGTKVEPLNDSIIFYRGNQSAPHSKVISN
ncbi:MAG: SpoIID/LytB domain-containing protein [Xenococcaceae cyanobacterium MO_167.B52]|nr:SpoIID/LytB domain-containing protein [Xenococcaceae cyanobacterium MO_167.B52]